MSTGSGNNENESQPLLRPASPFGLPEKKSMKSILLEPVLTVASSLLWIIVLPVAALVCSGIAISHRVATFVAAPLGA